MSGPRRRYLSRRTAQQALDAAEECWLLSDQVLAEVPAGSPAYQAACAVMDAIDGLAEVLTGERGHFYLKRLEVAPGKRKWVA
jgi:hypothetical protein